MEFCLASVNPLKSDVDLRFSYNWWILARPRTSSAMSYRLWVQFKKFLMNYSPGDWRSNYLAIVRLTRKLQLFNTVMVWFICNESSWVQMHCTWELLNIKMYSVNVCCRRLVLWNSLCAMKYVKDKLILTSCICFILCVLFEDKSCCILCFSLLMWSPN